ncbi:hypothetical protein D9757_005228 [Collybiopsis confluens]|uniref:Uncharacterized protein n=1 Tax=Collybiopsis confluens TaxID=2823264 RepID=A0A8H5HVL0_9AGAR|nr:hypothetical protein D9757_005228 [Collybiopsis confluens]
MSKLTLLPEELLCKIIESFAYLPQSLLDDTPPDFEFKCVSSELRSLSMVDKRIRRVCLPFLFAYVRVRDAEQLEGRDYSNPCILDLIKHVHLLYAWSGNSQDLSLLRDTLPQLKHLSCIDLTHNPLWINLTNGGESALIGTVLDHSSSMVLIKSFWLLPRDTPIAIDLSKIVVLRGEYSSNPIRPSASSCAYVSELDVLGDDQTDFWLYVYRGLRLLRLYDHTSSMAWFPAFTSDHPFLSHVVFNYDIEHNFRHHSLPFLDSFVDMSRQIGPENFTLQYLILTRTRSHPLSASSLDTMPFRNWHVSKLGIFICSSSVEVLSLISTSFPHLDELSICFEPTHPAEIDLGYDLDDLIRLLARFRSLRTIYSRNLFSLVRSPFGELVNPVDLDTQTLGAQAERRVHQYASRIALAVPSLLEFSIEETSFPVHGSVTWPLDGWLSVASGDGKVSGALRPCYGSEAEFDN